MELTLPYQMTGREIRDHTANTAAALHWHTESPILSWRPSEKHLACIVRLPNLRFFHENRIATYRRALDICDMEQKTIFLEEDKPYSRIYVSLHGGCAPEDKDAMDAHLLGWPISFIALREAFSGTFLETLRLN